MRTVFSGPYIYKLNKLKKSVVKTVHTESKDGFTLSMPRCSLPYVNTVYAGSRDEFPRSMPRRSLSYVNTVQTGSRGKFTYTIPVFRLYCAN